MTDDAAIAAFHRRCCDGLLAARAARGEWRGRLSSSALSTAVAAFALRYDPDPASQRAAARGLDWLGEAILTDGSWGDTPSSPGNLSTTLLALSALSAGAAVEAHRPRIERAEAWVRGQLGSTAPSALAAAVLSRYGTDRTFSVPILTVLALAGRLGAAPDCWQQVPALPVELAALPRGCFTLVGLPVVSYALPALIAMGWVRHRLGPSPRLPWRGPCGRLALRRLVDLQPLSGGFLEAAPLTAFVAMSLAASGGQPAVVLERCRGFLLATQRPDGSWPIDTDLATWVTTLAIQGLGEDLPQADRDGLREWLLAQQFRQTHPFTGAAPGGWAWTDLPGGVPDADDTAGALLALHRLGGPAPSLRPAAEAGLTWLLDLANRDGGIPTFCRGWGRLPFDRSTAEITAHALRAFVLWEPAVSAPLQARLRRATAAGLEYLRRVQRPDGAWVPLWFGHQSAPDHANPVVGTARVLAALSEVLPSAAAAGTAWVRAAVDWLVAVQGADGGWGGDRGLAASAEETALAVRALVSWPVARDRAAAGVGWLMAHPEALDRPAPIGLYFSSLWYAQDLYPRLFTCEALRAWRAAVRR